MTTDWTFAPPPPRPSWATGETQLREQLEQAWAELMTAAGISGRLDTITDPTMPSQATAQQRLEQAHALVLQLRDAVGAAPPDQPKPPPPDPYKPDRQGNPWQPKGAAA